MLKRVCAAIVMMIAAAAAPALAQCGDPNNMLAGDNCGFDASIGDWTAIPIIDMWSLDWGTPVHVASGGRTSPGAMQVDAVVNPGMPFSTTNAGAQYCIQSPTLVAGSQISFDAWVNPTAAVACHVSIWTDAGPACDLGALEWAYHDNFAITAGEYNQINAGTVLLDVTSASASAGSIGFTISCDDMAATPFTALFDDAQVTVLPRPYRVTATGVVEWNQVTAPPLGDAQMGDPVTMTFLVDGNQFLDGVTYPTRGYVIDQGSFQLSLGPASIGLQSPFPDGLTPYFTIRNDDPAVDGFMLVMDPDAGWPTGIPLDQMGVFEYFLNNFYVTYGGSALPSLDIADATGSWAYDGLEVFNWTVDDGGFNAIGINFTHMTIDSVVFEDGFESGDLSAWAETVQAK